MNAEIFQTLEEGAEPFSWMTCSAQDERRAYSHALRETTVFTTKMLVSSVKAMVGSRLVGKPLTAAYDALHHQYEEESDALRHQHREGSGVTGSPASGEGLISHTLNT